MPSDRPDGASGSAAREGVPWWTPFRDSAGRPRPPARSWPPRESASLDD